MKLSFISLFLFLCMAISAQTKLTTYEYWYNNDYGNVQQVSFAATGEHQISADFDVSALNDGVNVLNIRYKDENNKYSSTLSKVFFKLSAPVSAKNKLVAYEYWYNNDYDQVQQVLFAPATNHEINMNFDISALNDGVNVLNIRYKDENNKYSNTLSKVFVKQPVSALNNKIVAYQYWVDDELANKQFIRLSKAVQQVSVLENLDMTHLAKGNHTLYIRFLDSLGVWSIVNQHHFEKTAFPVADFSYTISANCDSTIVTFTNKSIDGDSYFWDFGDGNTSASPNPEHVYYTPGKYVVSHTVTDAVTSADSTVFIAIDITGKTYATIAPVVCDSYVSPSGIVYTKTDTYTDTISNYLGCDSIITINLTVNNRSNYTDTRTACGSFTWIDGKTYTSSNNTATYTLQTVSGCDSVVTLSLTLYPTPDNSVSQNGIVLTANQAGASYQWLDCDNNYAVITNENGQSFTPLQNGNYAVKVSSNGCSEVSNCYAITTVGVVENNFNHDIILYPNPTDGKIAIDLGKDTDEVTLTVQSPSGQIVKQNQYKNQQLLELYLDVPDGIYLISIVSKNKKAIMKVVKQ